jgi:pimeloyl-ACP methyl ester carboxylesterase
MSAREIVVDGIRIHFEEAGSGPTLFLVHGLGASSAVWHHTIDAFSDRWRVIAPDLPGHGRSGKPDAPYTVDFYAGFLRSFGHALGVDEAVVMGNSLGGHITIELALTYPAWTRAVVLVAPAGGHSPVLRPAGWALGSLARPEILRFVLPRSIDRCFYDSTSPGCAERRRVLAERFVADDYPDFARAVARSVAGVLRHERQSLAALRQPLLLVWGRQDRLLPLSHSKRIVRQVGHTRFSVIERCGHIPMLERPEEFNRLVAEFLRSVDAAPRQRSSRRAAVGSS